MLGTKTQRAARERNLHKCYDIFDEVLGTRSLVQLCEVRGSGQPCTPIEYHEAITQISQSQRMKLPSTPTPQLIKEKTLRKMRLQQVKIEKK